MAIVALARWFRKILRSGIASATGVGQWFSSQVPAKHKSNGTIRSKKPVTPLVRSPKKKNQLWLRLMEFLPFITRWGRRVDIPREREAYRVVFRNSTASEYVLPDIAELCYATEGMPSGLSDFEMGRWTGRHDVWLHIQDELNLTDQELYDIRRGHAILRQGE